MARQSSSLSQGLPIHPSGPSSIGDDGVVVDVGSVVEDGSVSVVEEVDEVEDVPSVDVLPAGCVTTLPGCTGA